MYQPKTIYTKIALAAIIAYLKKGSIDKLKIENVPDELLSTRRGCFVSLHNTDGALRGCIGTIEPHEKNLYREIIHYAVAAAFSDSRFKPLTKEELDDLEISVDVLTEPELINDYDDLDPSIYGVIVSDNNYHRAVLLPNIPTIDTVEQQLNIVKRKAGLSHVDNSELTIYRFTSNRYY